MSEQLLNPKATILRIWVRGLIAAGVSGASGGVMTGLAAVGIDPAHFNLQAGAGATVKIACAVAEQDASVQVCISDATAPPNQLPTDLLMPLKLWERANGSSDDFVEMVDLTRHGGLPSRDQDITLSVWEWRADGLWFVGATQDTQIRLRYLKAYPDLTDASSPVLVRNAQEALAYATAALAGWSSLAKHLLGMTFAKLAAL